MVSGLERFHCSGKFSYGANFRIWLYHSVSVPTWFIFIQPRALYKNKNYANFARVAAAAIDVSLSVLCQDYKLFANGSSQNTLVDMVYSLSPTLQSRRYRVSLRTWKAIGRGLASDQLRMRVISHCKHTKLKVRKFILRAIWSIIRKLAPTNISRYTVYVDARSSPYLVKA